MSEAVLPAAASPPARRSWQFRHVLLTLNLAAVAAVLALWWAATRFGWVAPIFLPAPGDVLHAARLTLASGDLLTDVVVSARRVFLGFALAAIVAERSVKGLVIGLPLNMDGSDGPRSQSARAMARNLADLGLPILMWDERWSTQAAERAMIEQDFSRAKRAQRIDSHAAALILQAAIDSLAGGVL